MSVTSSREETRIWVERELADSTNQQKTSMKAHPLFAIGDKKKDIAAAARTFLEARGQSSVKIGSIVQFGELFDERILYSSQTKTIDTILTKQLRCFQASAQYLIESKTETATSENGFTITDDGQVHSWSFWQEGCDFADAIDAAKGLLLMAYGYQDFDYLVTTSPSWLIASKDNIIRGVYLGNQLKDTENYIGEESFDSQAEIFTEPGCVLDGEAFANAFVASHFIGMSASEQ